MGIEGSGVRSSFRLPCCILEQDTFTFQKVLAIPKERWLRHDMTEKLLPWTYSLSQNKQNKISQKLVPVQNRQTRSSILVKISSNIYSFIKLLHAFIGDPINYIWSNFQLVIRLYTYYFNAHKICPGYRALVPVSIHSKHKLAVALSVRVPARNFEKHKCICFGKLIDFFKMCF